ncbi:MAG: hypothetical protein IJ735_07365 [Clostridia bacterium]|nr:hypothetical protein [Clostridia bacterium]
MQKRRLKRGAIALIVIAAVIFLIGCVILGTSLYAIRYDDDSMPEAALSEWMGYIEDGTLLRKVALPGSHDSGTAGAFYMAKTQDRTISQQLACGTRYFDIRVGKKSGEYRLFHGPIFGENYETVLKNLVAFLTAHPTEVVVWDMQHFGDGVQAEAMALTDRYLMPFYIKNESNTADIAIIDALTVGKARGKVVVFVGEDDGTYAAEDRFFLRNNDAGTTPDSCLHSYYDGAKNKSSAKKYVQEYVGSYLERYKAVDSGLFVLQGQLTDGLLVFGPKFRESQNKEGMDAYVKSLADSPDLSYVNIVMRDFVTPNKNKLTLTLNLKKGVVRADSLAAFTELIG